MQLYIRLFITVLIITAGGGGLQAQTYAVQDQNPAFEISRARYLKLADSLNSLHGLTLQETYKAIDYLEDKRNARLARRAWRNEYARQRPFDNWLSDYNYYSPFSRRPSYYSYRPLYLNSSYLWTTLPLAFMLGRWSR